jgi:tripartite-type tricarboxylate transporter receptor subunit TctC
MARKLTKILAFLLVGMSLLWEPIAQAQTQTSRIVVPYPAGQISDLIARTVREPLARQDGMAIMVENVAGAGGVIAAQQVISSAPGSNTLLLASPNEVILAPLVNAAARYKSEDFRMVAMVASAPLVLLTRPDLKATSVDEFVEVARRSSATSPLSYGSVGVGSLYHFMGEQLSRQIGASLTHVPYKGGGPLLQDMIGGRLDFAMLPWSQGMQSFANEGKLKILGVTALTRAPALPSLPTVNEGKHLNNFSFDIWTGFVLHKDNPPSVRERWHQQLNRALADPVVQSTLEKQGLVLASPMNLAELDAVNEREVARFRRLAADIRITPQ